MSSIWILEHKQIQLYFVFCSLPGLNPCALVFCAHTPHPPKAPQLCVNELSSDPASGHMWDQAEH